jgi:hypothetical protein
MRVCRDSDAEDANLIIRPSNRTAAEIASVSVDFRGYKAPHADTLTGVEAVP